MKCSKSQFKIFTTIIDHAENKISWLADQVRELENSVKGNDKVLNQTGKIFGTQQKTNS